MTDPNVRGPHNTPCHHCGAIHGLLCPWVSAAEYYPDGSLKRVEFRESPGCDGPELSAGGLSTADIARWYMENRRLD